MNDLDLPSVAALALLAAPLGHLVASLGSDHRPALRRLGRGLAHGGVLGFLVAGLPALGHGQVVRLGPAGALAELLAVRLDPMTAVLVALVGFLAAVLIRFSETYLEGDAARDRYFRRLHLTLACVTALLGANHLGVVLACWAGTSLALHGLLTHFAARPAAHLAAHKKFLVSRLADVALLGAGLLLWQSYGTLALDALHAEVALQGALPGRAVVALGLLALGASLRSAQLPFHGWLTQVMEAPTPVSALLHAGVVNVGGVVLLRLAPLLDHAPVVQLGLVAVGSITAVLAGLVLLTRVSIKVALAWSTIAQMGFMLVQIGLGAYAVALLHLVAHSLYKAHAFLSSGSTVERVQAYRAGAPLPPQESGIWVAAAIWAAAGLVAVGRAVGADPWSEPTLWALGPVVALALAPLLIGWRMPFERTVLAGGVALAWFGAHALFLPLAPEPGPQVALAARVAVVLLAFVGGYLVQAELLGRPDSARARRVHAALFAGLYLDEAFTRLTFRVWPPRLPPAPRAPLHLVRTSEA